MDLEVSRLGIFTLSTISCNFVSASLFWFDDGSKFAVAFLSLHLHEENVNVVLFARFHNYVVSLDVNDFEFHFAIDGYGNHVLCPHFNIVIIIDYYVVLDIYLWRKVVCFVLFCFVVMRSTEDASNHVLDTFGKILMKRGAWAWFHDIWTCGAKVLEYWMIFLMKIKLNHS